MRLSGTNCRKIKRITVQLAKDCFESVICFPDPPRRVILFLLTCIKAVLVIFPCEKAVWQYLPQIRADLALELVKTGMTQSQAAKKLGVTPAAVSQYIHKKRGMQSSRSSLYRTGIEAAVDKIRQDASVDELYSIVCNCCRLMQKEDAERSDMICTKVQQ